MNERTRYRDSERNCLVTIAETVFFVCLALILGGFCAWYWILSPEWMR